MPKTPPIPLEKITALPFLHRITITEDHLDLMGHMNVRHYLGIFDEAGWKFFESIGMTPEYYKANNAGGFALTQHLYYLAEVRLGETVSVYIRLMGRSPKRMHMLYFMVNETMTTLAATMESLGSHADLRVRRTSPYPAHIAANIDLLVADHALLDWTPNLSGPIQV